MFQITKQQEAMVTRDSKSGVFVVEASELELRPGHLPMQVKFQGREYTYYTMDTTDGGDDVAGIRYRHGGGAAKLTELLIIND